MCSMENNRKIPWRFAFLAVAVVSGGWLAFWGILQLLALRSLNTDALSLGIIGGADGPTAIFVTTQVGFHWELAVMAALLVAGIAGFLWLSRKKRDE